MNQIKCVFIIFLMIFVSLLQFSCVSKQEKNERLLEQQKKEWERRVNEMRAILIKRYNPIVLPLDELQNQRVFTYTVQRLLINEDKRPVLFDADIDDITQQGDNLTLQFNSYLTKRDIGFGPMGDIEIKFHLKASFEDIKPFIEIPHTQRGILFKDSLSYLIVHGVIPREYGIVCSVSDIRKITRYTQNPITGEKDEIEIESAPHLFIATGELIDAVKYPKIFTNP